MRIEVIVDPVNRQRDGTASINFMAQGEDHRRQLDISFESLYQRCGIPDPITLDLLIFGSSCYAIDKTVPRNRSSDNWTRELEVTVPVSAPDLWENAASEFERTLGFLSGDIWRFTFTGMSPAPFRRLARRRRIRKARTMPFRRPDVVCLFSGGLDSLAGAIDLISSDSVEHALLVGHYDAPGPKATQESLVKGICTAVPRRADLLQVRVSHRPNAASEHSQRTRSLVFISLGLYAARAFGPDIPLLAPENGLIAINVPLTPSRAGSCSTRTMHPYFLNGLRAALGALGISNPIVNPFEFKTKGECILECSNAGVLQSLVNDSVSCAHPGRRQFWVRRNVDNCGYCVPCIFRRAALHAARMDDGQAYGIDFCTEEVSVSDQFESADDLRAVVDFLRKGKDVAELTRDILRLAPVDRIAERAAMTLRGYDEIRSLIHDKGTPSLCEAARIPRRSDRND